MRVVADARGIGTHVGDETDGAFLADLDAFIQPLRQHHGALHAEAQLARGFLLQGGGDERRDRIALLLARGHDLDDVVGACRAAPTRESVASWLPSSGVSSLALDQARAEHRRSSWRSRSTSTVQYSRLMEGADLALALHDHAQRHGLHAAGGETAAHFVPEQRRDLVAHQPVEHAARLLRVHQVACSPARASRRPSGRPSW